MALVARTPGGSAVFDLAWRARPASEDAAFPREVCARQFWVSQVKAMTPAAMPAYVS